MAPFDDQEFWQTWQQVADWSSGLRALDERHVRRLVELSQAAMAELITVRNSNGLLRAEKALHDGGQAELFTPR